MADTYLEYATEAAAIAASETLQRARCAKRAVAFPEVCDQYIPGNFYKTAAEFNAAHPELAQRLLLAPIKVGTRALLQVSDEAKTLDATIASKEKAAALLTKAARDGLAANLATIAEEVPK